MNAISRLNEAFVPPDWSCEVPYAHTQRLAAPQWAWEFLRRNPEFRADWKRADLEYGLSGYDPPTTMLFCEQTPPRLAQWGCLYATSPDQDAATASVFWSPDICSTILRLNAFALTEPLDTTRFVLDDLKCASLLLEMPKGPQHLLFCEGSHRLQLVVDGADVMKPVRLVTNGAPDQRLAGPQLRALQCFNSLRLTGKLHDTHYHRRPISQRLRLVLRVLDAGLAGASQEEIAQKLYAEDYAAGLWQAPGQHLRDRVRRTLYRGHALMRKTYRNLLA